ncbi:hypothetical protein [Streptomyces sp. HSG2]|uniref:alpha/beta hydrolase n=1 Tax=Streptomyces sp. HSG2 TaxID=2797167 RepID=UPI0019052E6D|nr:hypothetical protein [Streptomyces sp. HSG2]
MSDTRAARRLVVALHGYGGTGEAIAGVLAAVGGRSSGADGDTVIVGPDGSCVPAFALGGRAWYAITSHAPVIAQRSREAAPAVAEYIERLRRRYQVPARQTCAVGFSQGASVAAAVLVHSSVCGRAVLVCGRVPGGDDQAAASRVVDALVVTGGRDRFVRHDDVRSDLASGYLGARARHVVLPELGHEFNEEVARLTLAHATSDGVNDDR